MKIIESGYIGDEDYFLIECSQCGENFETKNDNNEFCSKKCYKDAKYENDENN